MKRSFVKCKRTSPVIKQVIDPTTLIATQTAKNNTRQHPTTVTKICFWHDHYLEEKRKEVTQDYLTHLSPIISIGDLWSIVVKYVWCPIDLLHRELLIRFTEFTTTYSRLERVYGLLAILETIDRSEEIFHCMRMALSYPLFIQQFSANPLRSFYFSSVSEYKKEAETNSFSTLQERRTRDDQRLWKGELGIDTILNDVRILGDLTCYGDFGDHKISLWNSWSNDLGGNGIIKECECHRLLFEFAVTLGFISRDSMNVKLKKSSDRLMSVKSKPSQWGQQLISYYMVDVIERGDIMTLSYLIQDLKWDVDLLVLHISDSAFYATANHQEQSEECNPHVLRSFQYLLSLKPKYPLVVSSEMWNQIKEYTTPGTH